MKRFFIALLILIMTLGIAQGALAAEVPKTFDDIVVGGVTYYDLLAGKKSAFGGGRLGFFNQYLEISPSNHPALVDQWKVVYQAILEDGNFAAYKTCCDSRLADSPDKWVSKEGAGNANSIASAQTAILSEINGA
ncbi:MAG: hypothetical protein RSK76_11525, partial [Clostridia bacterium]